MYMYYINKVKNSVYYQIIYKCQYIDDDKKLLEEIIEKNMLRLVSVDRIRDYNVFLNYLYSEIVIDWLINNLTTEQLLEFLHCAIKDYSESIFSFYIIIDKLKKSNKLSIDIVRSFIQDFKIYEIINTYPLKSLEIWKLFQDENIEELNYIGFDNLYYYFKSTYNLKEIDYSKLYNTEVKDLYNRISFNLKLSSY